jgi:hypothetical protein
MLMRRRCLVPECGQAVNLAARREVKLFDNIQLRNVPFTIGIGL